MAHLVFHPEWFFVQLFPSSEDRRFKYIAGDVAGNRNPTGAFRAAAW
jgi:hypothetical protein